MDDSEFEIKVKITEREKIKYMKCFYKHCKIAKFMNKQFILKTIKISIFALLCYIILPIIMSKNELQRSELNNIISIIVLVLLISGLYNFIEFKVSKRAIIYYLKSNDFNSYGVNMGFYDLNNIIEDYSIGFTSNNIVIKSDFFKSSMEWENIKDIMLFENCLYVLETDKKLFCIIPLEKENEKIILDSINKYSKINLKKVK